MIYELSKTEFRKCRKLLNPEGQVEAAAVIRGSNPGRVFVDNLDMPATGLVWTGNNDGFIFVGNEQNTQFTDYIANFIDTVIKADAEKINLNCFLGVGNHEGWNPTLDKVFRQKKPTSWKQSVYTLGNKHDLPALPQLIPKRYQLKDITESFYNNSHCFIENSDYLHSKINGFWASPSDFFENGIGYCILQGNTIVSICFTRFFCRNTHCIDIETLSSHQNKQLAQFAAYAFVQRCIHENLLPYWDCIDSNIISRKVAKKIGLHESFSYKGIKFSFEEQKVLASDRH